MPADPAFKNALVIISPDLVDPGAPGASPLIARATELAKATGCKLELIHICHDPSLDHRLFAADDSVQQARRERLDREATAVAEVAARLRSNGLQVEYEVRWDEPRSEALLRKIAQSRPDVVLKASRDHNYVMGLMRNTDWDLIRRSPVPVWFVAEGNGPIANVLPALGLGQDGDALFTQIDRDLYALAQYLAESLEAATYPVHAYPVPPALGVYSAYTPDLAGLGAVGEDRERALTRHQAIALRHARMIDAFARDVGLDPAEIALQQGNPAHVLTTAAAQRRAPLLVMGARHLTRWERATSAVTAEPVLANASCDVLFVKEPEGAAVPEADDAPLRGFTRIDVERAITDPAAAFAAPAEVVACEDLSQALRRRILQLWEHDIRAQLTEESEGGPVRETKADILQEIRASMAKLPAKASRPAPGEGFLVTH